MKHLVKQIHASPYKAVIAITGGGTEAIGELLRHGEGSNTLIEAVVPYDQKAFDAFVRGKPDKYCSPGAARDLAMAAFQLAVARTGTTENMIGVGCSASLAKDVEREGREHHAYIAVQTTQETISYTLSLHGKGYNREEEETLVAEVIIKALAKASKLDVELSERYISPIQYAIASPELQSLVLGQRKKLKLEGSLASPDGDRIIFPGAFNPLHEQHANMAAKVAEIAGKRVDLELCVRNVDKPALNFIEINARTNLLRNQLNGVSWIGDLFLTSTPTFAEKAICFPGAKFLIGWDTFKRINDPKYGNLDQVVKTFKETRISFLVFHRIMNGQSSSLETTDGFRPEILEISKIFPADTLPPVEISSSEIRKRALH